MARTPGERLKTVAETIAWLIGLSLFVVVWWIIKFCVVAGVLYLGFVIFTDWNDSVRVACSLMLSLMLTSLLSLVLDGLNLLPVRWFEGTKDTKPCPECGKSVRLLAQQCIHCGANWRRKV